MNDNFLKSRLQRVSRRYQWLSFWRKLAAWWAVAALVTCGLVFAQNRLGWSSPHTLWILGATAVAIALGLAIHHASRTPDLRWVARKIEAAHPELDGVLLTAVQQDMTGNETPGFLQHRVVQEATARSQESDWRKVVPGRRLFAVHAVHLVALACFLVALANLRVTTVHGTKPAWVGVDGVAITPGDTKLEKGDSLVVLARFGGALPPTVSLIVQQQNVTPRTVPLVKSLADPVFGGSVPEVAQDLTYHLEYRGQKSKEFKVTVYEHPRLVRSDVDLDFPGYTKLPPKHIEDTRRVSAVEGTRLDFALQLNKPVKSAQLIARDGKKTPVPLKVSADKAVATLDGFVPAKTQSYDLQLIDADGRANKVASPFVIDVQPNRVPEVRLASPRGDVRPSALEEVTFDGTIFDDFGAPVYGLAYSVAGAEPKFIELGRDAAAKEKRTFNHLIKLEELGAKPDDLISWFAWAEDVGPDGKIRRTSGDLYFAEIRPFDEIFRESQSMQSEEDSPPPGQGQGNQARKLTELQKQIINATWKLQRDGLTPKYPDDVKIVRESQEQALGQATEAMGEARSPKDQAAWKEATTQMLKAVERLADAAKLPTPLAQALPAEQAAYQALLKLQARETAVTKGQKKGGGGGGKQGNQRQIDQLDLQQAENRYETQRQAKAPQNQERREQLAVMNRLQELARRQQDLNERLKELQTSLQEAKTEQEKEDVRRRLKRLEEEQRQMLADADEVRQRMDKAENQSSMTQQREQLDKTRDDLQKAAQAAADGSVPQALASGTRAQRQLQELRDDMRKQNSSQFAEEMRDMRNQARTLSQQQEEIGQKMEKLATAPTQRKSLSESGERKELMDQLTQQREQMNRMVDRATQISEQAENTEPLLSRQLYDSIRKLSQADASSVKQARDDLVSSGALSYDLRDRLQKAGDRETGGRALDIARDMLDEGALPQASRASQRAKGEIDDLRRGVERAAESVLGDDAEQLKLAQSELDQLTDQLQREIAQAQGGQPNGGQPGEPQPGRAGAGRDQRQAGSPGEPGQPGQSPGEPGTEPGQPGAEGQSPAQPPGEGQPGQKGGRARQVARNDQKSGQPGQGGQPGGQEPGQQPGEAQGENPGGGGGAGQQGQQGERTAENNSGKQQAGRAGQPQPGQGRQGQRGGQRTAGNDRGGGGGSEGRRLGIDDIFNGGDGRNGGLGGWEGGRWTRGPLTGEEFQRWNERLRDVEELVETPELRNAIAVARERARILRRDFKQDAKKPDWVNVQLQIIKPLVEVRNRVAEELARRDSKESLAPIDRDPVPSRFAESVRRYYEELGKDK